MRILHHGGAKGVTGSCHELMIDGDRSILVDCGLFQGEDCPKAKTKTEQLKIDFPIERIQLLVVTHCHIDHVGRIPYLLMAGFDKGIVCSKPTAKLLPLVLEDALKIGVTKNSRLIRSFLRKIDTMLLPLDYGEWCRLPCSKTPENRASVAVRTPEKQASVAVRLQPAGHILGSAFVEVQIGDGRKSKRVVFSGDLGAPYTPLLPAPKSPYRADELVLESTYGDREHQRRKDRVDTLKRVMESCFENRGTILVPAFSIGRTQELLYEMEQIVHRHGKQKAAPRIKWEELDIIVDSPLANRFTEVYQTLSAYWDREAKRKVAQGRHPLSFDRILTIGSHRQHLKTVEYLKKSARPAIVLAASGMCSGGRIVNYLKALIEDPRTDILFVGYQAKGTVGRTIQKYGPRKGYVWIDGRKYDIAAGIHTIGGYSAHADQGNLLRFIRGIRRKPSLIRLVHGENHAREALRARIEEEFPGIDVISRNMAE